MKICMIEAAPRVKSGSMGAGIVIDIASKYGQVDLLPNDHKSLACYDVELISVHHQDDYSRLVGLPKIGKIRVVGGHVTYTNPRPLIPLCDVVCVGDAEDVLDEILIAISNNNLLAIHGQKGVIVSVQHHHNDAFEVNYAAKMHSPGTVHLSSEGGFKHWCLEISRGCVYKCGYCEIGLAKYRFKNLKELSAELDSVDSKVTKRIRLVSPEEMSHPDYPGIRRLIKRKGLQHYSGGYRIEQFLTKDGTGVNIHPNEIVRVGIDGVSERLRIKANKRITDRMILMFFNKMISEGHCKFKLYQIIGYPGEEAADFTCWERLMNRVSRMQTSKNVTIDITWTPLIPQIGTQLGLASGDYPTKMAKAVLHWHKMIKTPKGTPGVFFNITRMVSKEKHDQTVALATGDEYCLLKAGHEAR